MKRRHLTPLTQEHPRYAYVTQGLFLNILEAILTTAMNIFRPRILDKIAEFRG